MKITSKITSHYSGVSLDKLHEIFKTFQLPDPMPRTYLYLSASQKPIFQIKLQENNLYEVTFYE